MKRLAAEWERQTAVMITLPDESTDWVDCLDDALMCYKQMAEAISSKQKLVVITNNIAKNKHLFSNACGNNIIWMECPINDTWIRDYGPLSVFDGDSEVLMDFQFNGWGSKFKADKDNAVSKKVFEQQLFHNAVSCQTFDFILEGGSIESDGQGTLMVTSKCLLNQNRNLGQTKQTIEAYLTEAFNLKQILWLDFGELVGDDTDGHIDTLARFCSADTIAYTKCYNADDEHYEELTMMEDQLKSFKTIGNEHYNLIPLPIPDAKSDMDGNRLPATYANFLIMNNAILLPVYNCASDKEAISQLQSIFPDREIIPIDASVLISQGGSIHCATMQTVMQLDDRFLGNN